MPVYDTLVYNGLEQTLAAWFITLDSVTGERNNSKEDTFDFEVVGQSLNAAPLFPFEAQIQVWSGRNSGNGAANSFSGGVCKFQGKRVGNPVRVTGNRKGFKYHFEGPWYDLRQTQYLQTYKGVSQVFMPGEIILNCSTANVFGLFQLISAGDQIQAVLQWLLDQYASQGLPAPFQYKGRALNAGKVDLSTTTMTPALLMFGEYDAGKYIYQVGQNTTIDASLFNFYLPTYIGKPMYCADVLLKCLELSPRTSIGFDYSTVPPTLHVSTVDNATPATFPVLDGLSNTEVDITPRYDLQARAVIITYRITNTTNGQQKLDYKRDKWSASGWNAVQSGAKDPDAGLRVVSETIDLQGFNQTIVTAHLDVEPLGARGGTQASKRAWWSSPRGGELAKITDSRVRFQNVTVAGGTTPTYTYGSSTTIPDAVYTYASDGFDSTGAAVQEGDELTAADYAFFTNKIVRGSHHSWMALNNGTKVKSVKVRVQTTMQYCEWDVPATGDFEDELPNNEGASNQAVNGNPVHIGNSSDEHCEAELTNGISGEYFATQSFTPGETYVLGAGGIAQYLFNTLNTLQYEGDYIKVAASFDNGPSVLAALNLSGGRPEWATMNAQVQSVKEDWATHTTSVQLGVAKHLNAGDLSSILNMWRFRRTWYNPLMRTDNSSGASNSVDMHQTAGGTNTTTGKRNPRALVATAYANPSDPTSTVQGSINMDAGAITDSGTIMSPQRTSSGVWVLASSANVGGVNYRGTYNSGATYNPGDIVRVQSGLSQGVWIRVGTGATTGSDPIFPEPSTTGGTNVWEQLAMGIYAQSVCVSGASKTQYMNAGAAQ